MHFRFQESCKANNYEEVKDIIMSQNINRVDLCDPFITAVKDGNKEMARVFVEAAYTPPLPNINLFQVRIIS